MGVTRTARRGWTWLRSDAGLRVTTVASIAANVLIVITGGAVRLTASGLGCPTWPRCTDGSLTRTEETGVHGLIEFTNRTLTFALFVVAVATLIAAIGQRRQIWLAAVALAGIPAQAVLGGISVLTHLNPWVVSAHLLLSMAILFVTVVLWWRVRNGPSSRRRPDRLAPGPLLARLVVAFTALTLVAGTVVTGSGPHAGSVSADGRHIHRNGLSPAATAQLHADLVMILIGLTVGLVLLLRATGAGRVAYRSAVALLVVELSQGVIGFVQYFTRLPVLLVGVHVAGACAVWVAALVTALRVGADPRGVVKSSAAAGRSEQLGDDVDDQADQRADHGAVHSDELQVPPDLQLQTPAGVRGVPAGDRR